MIKKIVIPAAGFGSRLLSVTKEIPKEMMPIFIKTNSNKIHVKPLIQIIYEQFFDLGLQNFCFVVGKQKRAIEDHFTPDFSLTKTIKIDKQIINELNSFYTKISKSRIFWINQLRPKGFGDAVLHSESFVDNDDFLVIAGDTLILKNNSIMKKLMNTKLPGKYDAALLLKEVNDPKRFGVAIVKSTKTGLLITNVEEKPKKPKSNLSIVALYRFKPSIFDALKQVKPRSGELQLTDGIQKLIEKGGKIHALLLDKNDKVIDIGTPESYLKNLMIE